MKYVGGGRTKAEDSNTGLRVDERRKVTITCVQAGIEGDGRASLLSSMSEEGMHAGRVTSAG